MFADIDHDDGFNIFPVMQKLSPKFVVFTGDNVYYDSEYPRALTADLARYHWQRMYGLSRHVDLIRQVATYWEKDDHDTHSDDSWPEMKPMGQFTFAEGQQVYRQQVPLAGPVYRTFRWGKWLQVWFTDGRDFRSPNNMADGPDKTIWGAEQKAWLKKTLLESDARWKVLVSPTPIVGPDRPTKNDNHTNAGFTHEGNEFRRWAKENLPGNFLTVCGDRHWQYHSVHPETGLHEFACGPGSDEHASGTPGLNETYHRFHRVKGGFLSVSVQDGKIAFRHHDVQGKVVHEWQAG
jgi:alkaline phosphatase D